MNNSKEQLLCESCIFHRDMHTGGHLCMMLSSHGFSLDEFRNVIDKGSPCRMYSEKKKDESYEQF